METKTYNYCFLTVTLIEDFIFAAINNKFQILSLNQGEIYHVNAEHFLVRAFSKLTVNSSLCASGNTLGSQKIFSSHSDLFVLNTNLNGLRK